MYWHESSHAGTGMRALMQVLAWELSGIGMSKSSVLVYDALVTHTARAFLASEA